MAYDERLAGRMRQLLAADPDVTEARMFGGIAFLVRGNMAISASGQGGALVRDDPIQDRSTARLLDQGGKGVAVHVPHLSGRGFFLGKDDFVAAGNDSDRGPASYVNVSDSQG